MFLSRVKSALLSCFVLQAACTAFAGPTGSAPASGAGFLYNMYCNSVVRYDASTGASLNDIELSRRTKFVPAESPRTAFCDLEQMTYDVSRHMAVMRVNDRDKRVFRLLRFRIPEFTYVSGIVLPERWHDDGDERPEPKTEPFAGYHLPGLVTGGQQAGWLDAAGYTGKAIEGCTVERGGRHLLVTEPVAQKGAYTVLNLFCNGRHMVSVDAGKKRVAMLDLPSVSQMSQSADGRYLETQKGDEMWLADLETGTVVRHWQGPRFADAGLFAFGPQGRLLVQGKRRIFVEPTGLPFAPTPPDNGFFADR